MELLGGKFPQRRKSGRGRESETDRSTLKQIEDKRGTLTHYKGQETESEHRGSPLFRAAGLDGDIAEFRLLSLVWDTQCAVPVLKRNKKKGVWVRGKT